MTLSIEAALEFERGRTERRMRTLDEIGELLRRLDDEDADGAMAAPEPPRPPPPAPAAPPREAPANRNEPDLLYERMRRYVLAEGPVAYGQIADAVGGTKSKLLLRLRWLAEDGAIAVEGRPPHRRYLAPETAEGAAARPDAPLAATMSCEGPDELLDLIREHAPVSSSRLRELTGVGYPQLLTWGRALARRRDVTFDGDGPDRIWRLAGTPVLASEVLAAIAAEPGRLNERRIALALRAKHEHVVHACAELLDGGAVTLTETNTYLPVAGTAARARR